MRTIESLIQDYLSISKQLAYYVSKKNAAQVAKYEHDQKDAALKIVTCLMGYHGFSVEDVERRLQELEQDE